MKGNPLCSQNHAPSSLVFFFPWLLIFLLHAKGDPDTGTVGVGEARRGTTHPIGIDLVSAVRKAREINLELSLSFSQNQIEETLHRLGYRQFLPRITIGYSRNDTVLYHHPDTYRQRLSLGIEQDIFDHGERYVNLQTEEKNTKLRGRLLSLQEEELSLRVVDVFLKAIELRLQGEILVRAIEKAGEHGRIAHMELSLGEITEVDYLSILLKRKDLELELASLRREEEQVLFEFRSLLGCLERDVFPTGRIDTDYNGFLPLDQVDRYVSLAVQCSTELEELSIQRESLAHKVQVARSSYLPSLTLQVELSMEGNSFPLTEPGLSIACKLAWPTPAVPFSMGIQVGKQGYYQRSRGLSGESRVGGNLENLLSIPLAQLHLQQNEAKYNRTLEQIRFDLRQAFSLLREKAERLKLLREKSSLLEKKLMLQQLKLSLGEVTRLELLESEIELSKSKSAILQGVAELFLQETSILKLCGLGTFGTYPTPLLPETSPWATTGVSPALSAYRILSDMRTGKKGLTITGQARTFTTFDPESKPTLQIEGKGEQ
mgnify:CR=1 FL=1